MLADSKEDNLRNLIIDKAEEQFFNYGFANTTTQQIAEAMEISKKTLYKYFASKEDLLSAVLDTYHREIEFKIQTVIDDSTLDFLEKLKEVTKVVGTYKSKFTPQLIRDLQKVNPEQWQNKESPPKRFAPYMEKLFNEGVQTGMIRKDVDQKLIMLIISSAFEHLLCGDVVLKIPFSISEIIEAIPKVITEGILTEKAREKYLAN